MMSNAVKKFDILAISLNVLRNYFDNSLKLFSDLYLAKCLDTSAKSFSLHITRKSDNTINFLGNIAIFFMS